MDLAKMRKLWQTSNFRSGCIVRSRSNPKNTDSSLRPIPGQGLTCSCPRGSAWQHSVADKSSDAGRARKLTSSSTSATLSSCGKASRSSNFHSFLYFQQFPAFPLQPRCSTMASPPMMPWPVAGWLRPPGLNQGGLRSRSGATRSERQASLGCQVPADGGSSRGWQHNGIRRKQPRWPEGTLGGRGLRTTGRWLKISQTAYTRPRVTRGEPLPWSPPCIASGLP